MYIIYYDESGDDGYPKYASPIFTLSANYLSEDNWRVTYNDIKDFRISIKSKIPMKMEIHTKDFILNKNPFRKLCLTDNDRISIVENYCLVISRLRLQVVNIVINKTIIQNPDYDVLDRALTYSTQRIENSTIDDKLLIISDEGRINKMRKTTRRIQVYNPVPSKTKTAISTSHPIERLIEDPLPKLSVNSYFIQISDLIAFLVYNYMLPQITRFSLNPRFPSDVNDKKLSHWLDVLEPVFNTKASKENRYGHGIVCYPQP
jgi:hypothetical protein